MPPIYRVTTIGSMYGQQCQNVLHFIGPEGEVNGMSSLADELAARWIPTIRSHQTASFVYNAIRVRDLTSNLPVFTKVMNVAGAWGTDTEVSTVLTWIVRLRTNLIGKTGRGRFYVSGVLKGWTSNGLVTQARIDAWNLGFASLLGLYGPSGSTTYRLGVCNKTAPFTFKQVTSMQIAPTLGTQRRRNIGIGV